MSGIDQGPRTLRAGENTVLFADVGGRLTWSGLDGCNRLSGRVSLGPDGRFDAGVDSSTPSTCDVPSTRRQRGGAGVLEDATAVRIDQGQLRFYEGTKLLGAFVLVKTVGADR